jgi:hypothetical protein
MWSAGDQLSSRSPTWVTVTLVKVAHAAGGATENEPVGA